MSSPSAHLWMVQNRVRTAQPYEIRPTYLLDRRGMPRTPMVGPVEPSRPYGASNDPR